jgi:hypothetical protein
MNTIAGIYSAHPYISTLVSYWILSAFIGALPSPTANSSALYVFVFKFSNSLGGNLLRALSTRVESSPNFAQAVNIQNAKTGTDKIVVEMPAENKQ